MLGAGLGVDLARQLTASEPKKLAEAGCGFICRYVTGIPGSTLTRAEANAISAAGLAIVSVFETLGTKVAYFTRLQGAADGRRAALNASLAGQTGAHIFAAVDYDAQPKDLPAIEAYMAAFAAALGPDYQAGIYGSLILATLPYPLWQTMAWSRGVVRPKARIVQVINDVSLGGVGPVDVDVAMGPLHDLGWHLTLA
jgi:hypothetical protein